MYSAESGYPRITYSRVSSGYIIATTKPERRILRCAETLVLGSFRTMTRVFYQTSGPIQLASRASETQQY